MEKIIYIIPGYSEYTKEKKYKKIGSFFKKKRYDVKYIDISWKYKTMSDYVKEFEEKVLKDNLNNFSILGFSFGAMIAFSSIKLKPKQLFLCSLSPYFKEDLPKIKPSWKSAVGKRMMKDVENFSFNKLVKKVNCKTFLFVGEKEHPLVLERTKIAHKNLKNSKLIVVPNAKHDIGNENYLKVIEKIVN